MARSVGASNQGRCAQDVRFVWQSLTEPTTSLGPNEEAAIAAFEVRGTMAQSSDLPQGCGGMSIIRIVDKLKALELHGKAMGCFDEQRLEDLSAIVPPSITVEFAKPQASYLGVALSRSS